jgi:hypothetical protein
MITLAYEVWQQKKQEKNQVTEMASDGTTPIGGGSDKSGKIVNVGNKQISFGSSSDHGKTTEKGLPTITGFY